MNLKHSLGLVTFAAMLVIGNLSLAGTPATWNPAIHGGDDLNYSDPNNWDIAAVPINNGITYDVIIPTLEVLQFDVGVGGNAVDTFSLAAGSTFTVNAGLAFDVLGTANLGGRINTSASTFSAPSATVLFTGRPTLFADAGGTIQIGAAVLNASYLESQTIMRADGTLSQIDLSSLGLLVANDITAGTDTLTIHARNNGHIDLSGINSAASSDILRFLVETGGSVDLSSLNTGDNLEFEANGAAITTNALTQLTDSTVDLKAAGAYNATSLTALLNSTLAAEAGTTFNAPALTNVSNSLFTLDNSFTFVTDTLTNINGTRLLLSGGFNLNTVSATSLNGTYIESQTIMRADGVSTMLDLSSLTSFVANDITGGFDTLTVHALNAGHIDLSNVASASSNDLLRFLVESGGSIDLAGLITTQQVEFEVGPAATQSVGALVDMNGGGVDLKSTATLNAGSLAAMRNVNFAAEPGSVFNAPNLTDVSGTTLNLNPGFTFNVGSLANVTGSRLLVSDGLSFNLVSATSMSGNYAESQTVLQSTGTGSQLDLSSLQSLALNDVSGGLDTLTVHAQNNGHIDLSNIASATSNDLLRFLVETGGSIDLASLASTTNVEFEVGISSTQSAPALANVDGGAIDLKAGATLNAGALNALRNANFTAAGGAAFNAPNLTDVSGSTVNLDPGFTFNVGALNNVDGARLFVSGGKNFNSVVATAMTGNYAETQTVLQADGTGSLLDLSTLQSLALNDVSGGVDTLTIAARNSGKVDLSGVTNLSTNDQVQVLATSQGEVDLTSLQSVTGTVFFDVDAESTLKLGNFTVTGNTTFNINDATSVVEVAGSLLLDAPAVFNVATAGGVSVGGNFSFASQNEAAFNMDDGILKMLGVGSFVSPQFLEVGGEDLGTPSPVDDPTAIPGTDGNFAIGQLVIGASGQATVVELLDAIDNGNGPGLEVLYLPGFGGDGLQMFGGSTLVLESINVYAFLDGSWIHLNSLFGPGVTSIPLSDLVSDPEADGFIVIPEPATALLCLFAAAAWRRGRQRI